MAKKLKAIICIIVSFAVLLPCIVFSPVFTESYDGNSGEEFRKELSAIYAEYDKDIDSLDENEPFALARILVNGWNGKKYGATETAYDCQNDFAVLQYKSSKAAQEAQKEMLADGLCAEADTVVKPAEQEITSLNPTYSEALGITGYTENIEMDCENVIVAVVDTGVMYDHEAIASRMISHGVDLSEDGFDDAYYDTQQQIPYYCHSTAVCSVIADNTPENVKILPVKVFPFESISTSVSAIISGINYAVSQNADVINLSLGGNSGSPQSYKKAVDNALAKGACVCACAGNDSEEISNYYPACVDGVITVSALNNTLSELASFSNYGDCVDFCAPGAKVYCAYPDNGAQSYNRLKGTSFSTPFISAQCADLKCVNKELTQEDIYGILCDFCTDYGESGRDSLYGYGMPDIGNIVYGNSAYEYRIPQGVLNIHSSENYTAETQPWRIFAPKMKRVVIDGSVNEIGDYMFYNMPSAVFSVSKRFTSVGDYAFYNCKKLKSMSFNADVSSIGYKAFGNIDNFTVKGYRNTPAETYALIENVNFVKLGCKHNYYIEVVDPEGENAGYTLYTCSVCKDSYISDYIEPVSVISGSCGENLTYNLDVTGRLTIDGSGEMFDYTFETAPWYNYREDIKILNIRSGVTSVSPFAFYGCSGIVKVYVNPENAYFSSDGISVMNKQGTELLLCFAHGAYPLPESVSTLYAPAFIAADSAAIGSNTHITVKDSVLYDENGNILAALPNYRERTLVINEPVTVKEYAFILSSYPQRLETSVISLTPESCSLGYVYNGTLQKHDFTVRACTESGAAVYAVNNGFTLESDVYRCGDELTYTYDSEKLTLTVDGKGAMYNYGSVSAVPWSSYMTEISTVVIADGVTSLSPNAFNGARYLYFLTMPLSLEAPSDSSTWSGCTAVKKLNLTLGSGYMDDYVLDDGTAAYTFMPWYLSRATITEFNVDSNVKYIGKSAFRGTSALNSLTLNCVEEIAEDALLACAKLTKITILSKNAVIADYSMLSYKAMGYKLYSGHTLFGYSDSTVKDYCDRLGAGFVSLGCGHSRSVSLVDSQSSGTAVTNTYYCNDCQEQFSEVIDISLSLSGTLVSTLDNTIDGAIITVGEQSAETDYNGSFTVGGLTQGAYPVTVTLNGAELFSGNVTVTEGEHNVKITVRYADYVTDGVINAKDYAYALRNGYNDFGMFDFGKISPGDNKIETVE